VTAAADMWSWGVTIAFAGTGQLPFKGESLTATAFAIFHSDPDVGRLPEPLGSLVYRCLNKDSAIRPSAREALSELVAAGARLMGPMPPMASGLGTAENTASSEPAPAARPEPASAPPRQPRHGSGDGLTGGGPVSRLRWGWHGIGPAWRRWAAAALLTLILVVAGAGGLALTLSRRGAPSDRPAGGDAGISQKLTAEAAARKRAVTWILHQVGRAQLVSCDFRVCAELAKADFPAANVVTLGPMSKDPNGSALVVATADVRAHFGSQLAVYAPAIIASFGSGAARIDIRLVFPGGARRYRAVRHAALLARKAADAQLLTNSNIMLSAKAKAQLLRGQIDPRLPPLIVQMAAGRPLRIVDFASQSPGGGPASLLRWVDLATAGRAAHLTRPAYVRWMWAYIHVQQAPFRPAWARQVTLPGGQTVLRIGYGAPSPLR